MLAGLTEALAQDFKLYFANNVTDVSDFNEIETSDELNWREVQNGDISGNQVEVDAVKQMFASEEMKGVEQQQQYWKMRDHSLLCFRIGDGEGKYGNYEVEVKDGTNTLTMTASRYFYTNAPLSDKPLEVRVWPSRKKKSDGIYFRYYVYDWDDSHLYTFNLDAKRQLEDETYKIEYVLEGMDENGSTTTEIHQLEIRNKYFQTFYVPEDRQLQDVFLMSGKNRLRINKSRLHPGTSPYTNYDVTRLTPSFVLDKHENRELVNFNALGSGLYEHFDTLYVTLLNEKGAYVSRATFNVERVDENGHRINDADVKYLKYDSNKKAHLILTHGHPAYIEILSNGYLPTIYKYSGSADPITGIVSEELCNATIMLKKGNVDESGFALAQQNLITLKDEKIIVVRGDTDYCLCSEEINDLGGYVPTDTLFYSESCGHNYPKMLNNKSVERLAQAEMVYSLAANAIYDCTLNCVEEKSGAIHTAQPISSEIIRTTDFPSFSRNYYFQRFDLVGAMPQNVVCRLQLKAVNTSYNQFPLLVNHWFDREQSKKDAEDDVNNDIAPDQSSSTETTMADSNFNVALPINFKFSFNPLVVKTSVIWDFSRQLVDFQIVGIYDQAAGPHEGESDARSAQRQEVEAAAGYGYGKWNENGTTKYNLGQKSMPLKNDLANAADDIFTVTPALGAGWFGGFKVGLRRVFTTGYDDEDRDNTFLLTEASGNIGYAFTMSFPNLIDKYLGNGPISTVVKKIPCLSLGGQFGASAGLTFGMQSFDPYREMSSQNSGFFTNFEAQAKAGVWAQLTIPSNPILCGTAGLRAGVKFAFRAGAAVPFDFSNFGYGVEFFGLGVIEAFANIHTPLFHWSGKAGVYLGGSKLFPDDGYNPFHKDFPAWLNDGDVKSVGDAWRAPQHIESSNMGEPLISNVAIDANPHFLDEQTVVVNHLGHPDDYNDDYVATVDLQTKSIQDLSMSDDMIAHSHMRSKRGDYEVVVYEESTVAVDNSELNDENAAEQSNNLANHTRIMSAFRQPDGTWLKLPVSPLDDNGIANNLPVVTIQDDGKAACVWQRGISEWYEPETESEQIYPYFMNGHLVYSYYDGNEWSQPKVLFAVGKNQMAGQYDLIMRNDTVLIGCNVVSQYSGPESRNTHFIYFSCGSENLLSTYYEDIKPERFFMNRVGQHAVIAMLYEKSDSLKDIYVKTLNMNGHNEGCVGNNLNLSFCHSQLIKIVCDRSAQDIDDFAILWTEMNNTINEEDGSHTTTDDVKGLLNASRVHLTNTALCVTAPITLGTDQNGMVITDFDGVLDDSRIRVVYSLADPQTGGAVVMTNEKYFQNSFESDVTYSRNSLASHNLLPVNVMVHNTGTSAIKSVTATINGQDFIIPDSYVAPLRQQTFIVNYPVDDDFDGYMSTNVTVEFDNVFKAKSHPRHAKSFIRQTTQMPSTRIKSTEEIGLKLIGQSIEDGVNTFVVELTDNSMRGMNQANTVIVGLYAHPGSFEPLTNEAEVRVSSSDFMIIGGKRKAFATISIDGITQPIKAFINTRVVDTSIIVGEELTGEQQQESIVDNVLGFENTYAVRLYPTDNPTDLRQLLEEPAKEHRIHLEIENNGVRLSGLKNGEHIRLFTTSGITVFSEKIDNSSLFIPLEKHGIYLLTGEKEVFKFRY